LRRDGGSAELPHQFVSDGDQSFAGTNNVALAHRDLHTREAGLVRRQEGDGLVVHPGQGARPFDDLPMKREVVLDAAPRTIAR
jgi:hypothetical protein